MRKQQRIDLICDKEKRDRTKVRRYPVTQTDSDKRLGGLLHVTLHLFCFIAKRRSENHIAVAAAANIIFVHACVSTAPLI